MRHLLAFFLALLSDPEQGVMLSANDSVRPQIQAVIDLYIRQVAADYPSVDEWSAADSAAAGNHFLWQAELLISLLKAAA